MPTFKMLLSPEDYEKFSGRNFEEDFSRKFEHVPSKPIDRKAIWDSSDGHCAYCGRGLTLENYTIDHILPRSKGGTDHISNLTIACMNCNRSKKNSTLSVWRKRLEKLRKRSVIFYFEQRKSL